jgi:hypothetical protein
LDFGRAPAVNSLCLKRLRRPAAGLGLALHPARPAAPTFRHRKEALLDALRRIGLGISRLVWRGDMKRISKSCLFLALTALTLASLAFGQTATTGALSGLVTDESGGVLPGATVEALHEPTGTRYSAVTGADGRFAILNVRVGGPYAVSVTLSGFRPQKQGDVSVALGEDRYVTFKMPLAAVTETVEVTAELSIISPSSTGPASNVSQEAIESLPTIARAIQDFARVSPYFVSGAESGSQDSLSVAGRNNRYNNVQIDGAVNNDLFGLAASGTPGGQTEAQPISLDAIQELQLVVAPYDVRLGAFTGGGLNAVTRSGTNQFKGSAYFYNQNESLVGDGPSGIPIATFSDKQYGASLGGPIVKDKVFFFANADFGRRERPVGISADGSSGQAFQGAAQVDRFLSILQSRYGYSPGDNPKAEFIRNTPNNKFIGKLDFNLSQRHRLTLRHNYIKSDNDIGTPSVRTYLMPDQYYEIRNNQHSSVIQLNSTIGTAVNEFRLTFQRIRDQRDGPTDFPNVTVDVAPGVLIRFGRETFSTANQLDQDIIELNDDFTFRRGNHLFTIGTHNEFIKFRNLFIRDNFGSYRFASLELFEQGLAQQFDHSFSATSDPRQAAKFKVNQIGFYAGDMWRVNGQFTLNYGVRLDMPSFPDKPTANPAAIQNFGFATDVVPSPAMISPRAGFNWNLGGGSQQQVRGGIGIFTGRTPYVWLSNQYGNTGIEFTRIGASFNANNRIPFVTDPKNQPRTVTGAIAGSFSNEIDVIDPDYQFPKLLRTNLSYDRELGFAGLVGTVEGTYSKNLKDIAYANLNFAQTGTRPDGRPLHSRRVAAFSDVILLKNTEKGRQWSVMAELKRPPKNALFGSLSWLYGQSYSVNDGGSSQAISNWRFTYTTGDPNNVPLGISTYSPGNRIVASLGYNLKLGRRASLLLSTYYSGYNGRPYTFVYNGDWNGDTSTGNDLMYVPAPNDPKVTFTNGTAEQFEAFVAGDKALQRFRGRIIERGAARTPWTNRLDFRSGLSVPVNRTRLEVNFDIQNLLNLLNSDWGVIDYASFSDLGLFPAPTVNAAGQIVQSLATITSPTFARKFDRDDLRSRWQGQISFRVRF